MKKRLFLLAAVAAALIWGCAPASRVNSNSVSSSSVASVNVAQEVCDIENVGTRKFLEEVDYSDDPEYTVSYARDYRKNFGANDKPLPVVITWAGGNASKIVMSTSSVFDNSFEVEADSSPAEVFNLIPGVTYYYKVVGVDGSVIKQSSVMPLGPMRMINGVADNVRDLGGWKVDGGTIAYGKLFRGAALERISDKGKGIFLNDLGIALDLDLRGSKDSEKEEKHIIKEADYIRYPVIKNLGRGEGDTQELYQKAIRTIIQYLGEGKNVYFHCAGGADRTGTLAFLIEALIGVTESDMSKDYELTTFDSSNKRARNFRAAEDETHILYETITYLRKFGDPQKESIQELAVKWATTRHSESVDPLTMEEINLLRQYLIVK